MAQRELIARIDREIEDWPGVAYRVEARSGWDACVLSYRTSSRFVRLPGNRSSSDPRVYSNVIRDVREQMRIMGAEHRPRPKRDERREHHPPPPPPALKPKPPADNVSDPREGGLSVLAEVLHNTIAAAINKWSGQEVVPELKKDATLELLETWHPDIILEAARLVRQCRDERKDHNNAR